MNSKKPTPIPESQAKGMVDQLIEDKLEKRMKCLKEYFDKKIADVEKKRIDEKEEIQTERSEMVKENRRLNRTLKDYQAQLSKFPEHALTPASEKHDEMATKKTEHVSKLMKENEALKDVIQCMKDEKRDLLERCDQRSVEAARLTKECEVLKGELKEKNTLLEGRSKQFEARFKEVQDRLIRQEDQWKLQRAALQRDHNKLETLVEKLHHAFTTNTPAKISHGVESPPSSIRSNHVTHSHERFSKAKTK